MVSDLLSWRTPAYDGQGGMRVDTYVMRGAGGQQVIWGQSSSQSLSERPLTQHHQERHHQGSLLGGSELKSLYSSLNDGFGKKLFSSVLPPQRNKITGSPLCPTEQRPLGLRPREEVSVCSPLSTWMGDLV